MFYPSESSFPSRFLSSLLTYACRSLFSLHLCSSSSPNKKLLSRLLSLCLLPHSNFTNSNYNSLIDEIQIEKTNYLFSLIRFGLCDAAVCCGFVPGVLVRSVERLLYAYPSDMLHVIPNCLCCRYRKGVGFG